MFHLVESLIVAVLIPLTPAIVEAQNPSIPDNRVNDKDEITLSISFFPNSSRPIPDISTAKIDFDNINVTDYTMLSEPNYFKMNKTSIFWTGKIMISLNNNITTDVSDFTLVADVNKIINGPRSYYKNYYAIGIISIANIERKPVEILFHESSNGMKSLELSSDHS